MKPEPQLATRAQGSNQPPLARSDVEALMVRDARPETPVLSVYLDTDQSDAVNLQRAFETVFKNMLRDVEVGKTRIDSKSSKRTPKPFFVFWMTIAIPGSVKTMRLEGSMDHTLSRVSWDAYLYIPIERC